MVKSNCMNPINLVKSLIKQMEYQEIKVEEGNKICCVFDTEKISSKSWKKHSNNIRKSINRRV